jgi:hypothetical protein
VITRLLATLDAAVARADAAERALQGERNRADVNGELLDHSHAARAAERQAREQAERLRDRLIQQRDEAIRVRQEQHEIGWSAIQRLSASLEAERARGERLLRLLWLRHGHQGLYGDDGEMQCGVCVLDFKRASLDWIEQVLLAAPASPAAEPESADQATAATAAQASPKAQGE